MTLEDLKQYAPYIDQHIEKVLCDFADEVQPEADDEQAVWALSTIREYALRPGKRLRGALAACLYDVRTGQKYAEAGLSLAAVIELIHDYLLILDDVMDRSATRRGLPTVHEQYKRQFSHIGANEFEADMMAVNVGLLVQHIASWALSRMDMNTKIVQQIMHRNIGITGFGQMADVAGTVTRPATSEQIIKKYYKKSSIYTFVNPLLCALALAGDTDETAQRQVEAFGLPAGLAFQLRDDWLGIFGSPEESGKSNLDDIHEGKNTFLVQETLERCTEDQKKTLLEIIGNEQATEDDLKVVKDVMMQTGAVDVAQGLMEKAGREACEAARVSSLWTSDFAGLLQQVVQYSMERIK